MDSSQKHYGKYNIDFLAQHLFANRHLFTARLAGQLSSNHYLPSADQFYIGGVNGVRGYSLNLGYAIPAQPIQMVLPSWIWAASMATVPSTTTASWERVWATACT